LSVSTAGRAASYVFDPIDVPNAVFTVAEGINNRGQVVGAYADELFGPNHGFVYNGIGFTTIDFPDGSDTIAFGINNHGQIVGSYLSQGQHGFIYRSKKYVFTSIDVPSAGVFLTRANGINNRGQIVGEYLDNPSSNEQHGFVYDNGMFTSIDFPEAFETVALGINKRGQIVGFYADGAGVHGFIATPKKKVTNVARVSQSDP